jgi:hypothetical protein
MLVGRSDGNMGSSCSIFLKIPIDLFMPENIKMENII